MAIAAGLGVVFGLQELRVFLPLCSFHLYDARSLPPLVVAVAALPAFAAGLAAPWLARRLGWGRALAAVTSTLALIRVLEQAAFRPALDVWLAAAGTTLFVALLGLLLAAPARPLWLRGALAAASLAALAGEAALRALTATLDLSWMPGPGPLAGVALAAVAALAAARAAGRIDAGAPAPPAAWASTGAGAWLFLHLELAANPAAIAARSGAELADASAAVILGAAVGVALPAVARLDSGGLYSTLGALVATAAGLALGLQSGSAVVVLPALLAPGLAVLWLRLCGARSPGTGAGPWRAGGSGLVLLGLLFLYYGRFDHPLPIGEAALLYGGFALLAGAGLRPQGDLLLPFPPARTAALVGGALLGLAAPLPWLLHPPAPAASRPPQRPLRVMAYNLHQGFDTTGRLGPEALARVIESEDPDVVALQEVSRGWLVTGGLDLFDWLQRRLGMDGVFAGTADRAWGNAILARVPLTGGRATPLPPADLPLRRGVVEARADAGAWSLRVLSLHLHHRRRDDAVRLEQAEALLAQWNGSPRTVMAGDFNAVPGSAAIARMRAAGLDDASRLLPPGRRHTTRRRGDRRQIDWIFATPDLDLARPSVVDAAASDHFALAVEVAPRASAETPRP